MKKPVFISAGEAADMIKNGSTLCTTGMTLVSTCESILKAIEKKFMETGEPRDLTLFHTCGQSDKRDGLQHIAHEHLIKRVVGGHWGLCPAFMELISSNKVEAYNLPQGQMANMFHSMALREPGKISKIGLGTYIDPRVEGGKMNDRTKDLEDIVGVVTIDGEEYLQYKEIPIDTLLIRGTYCDEMGNLSTEEEAMVLEILPAVMAAKRFGGKVICQVKHVVKTGTINPKEVVVPGVLVDAVVVCDDLLQDHRQTSSWYYDPSYSGQAVLREENKAAAAKLSVRKAIGRRAAMLLEEGAIINVGTGIPNDVMGPILAEEDIQDKITITVESGIYGGVPAGGIDFGISRNAMALIAHDRQFEYYTGTGIDFTFMGAGEMDQYGNVNATKMGSKAAGAGGFVDITTTAKNVIFCSTFTGGGLEVDMDEKGLRIKQEGRFKKLVKNVQQISYNGRIARERGQKMYFVTERAVFRLTKEGPLLTEIAEGVDLQRDILEQMEFEPLLAEELIKTPVSIYRQGAIGIKEMLEKKEGYQ
ncbi:acyl CoA:acetate/3-ketoacid CoA transferase [Lactonifactor longoviformis]|uniref:Propionate CoA-transferase n=1 Tax=Lactonifactor longoviformis DSM 17459 TaxID=1122155 RepID=A0A1M4VNA2_9CLOT|nr:CoA-transferase [Lactonifactor longoviformis]POP34344.1 acyl CoA:acetate/3-ketoacid CoA transferase [Lactonifactor longoviformis]SHE70449.1 propionate CoA-transferase [Lactonifactor longoviformis DSM 17459]